MWFLSRSALWAIASVSTTVLSQSLPYNPTTILLPSSSSWNKDIAYVFLPNPSTTDYYFASVNISSTLSSSISLQTLSSNLPFTSDNSEAFVPSISSDGQISVYAGSCSTLDSSLWIFTPANISSDGNGTWTKEKTDVASGITPAYLTGANFLSKSFNFSPFVHANASETFIYVFGGMCPNSSTTASTWQLAASYSSHMLRLTPGSSDYALDITYSTSPPIAEAGFTFTGLTPTFSNGSELLTQQQNFVLLGGHTQTAFINMSQVAIWSDPEESWSFVTVASTLSSNPNTELAVKSTVASVDSRSGHTAVLSEDGSKIIVLGGWVGDISQAADPQLAVLELGTGFGGSGDWVWSIPSQQPPGTGLYGHGAVMLPGNIMMVLGGYNISGSSNSKRDATSDVQPMFLNATSLSWISNYTNPAYVAAVDSSGGHSSSSTSSKKTLGLAIGLGVGLTVVLIAVAIWLWFSRRRKTREVEEREKHIQDLSAGASNYFGPNGEVRQRDGRYPLINPYSDLNSQTWVYSQGDNAFPSLATQITRKPLHTSNTRGYYQPASTSELARSNTLGTAGPIHPIYEADEDDHASQISDIGVGVAFGDPSLALVHSSRYSDPFRDPQPVSFSAPLRSSRNNSPDPESPTPHSQEVQQWFSDWAAADALLESQARSHSSMGRVSPSRRARISAGQTMVSSVTGEEEYDRAGSSLSDHSVSISSVSRSGSSSHRTNSLRGFITNAVNPFNLLTVNAATTGAAQDPRHPPQSAGSGTGSFATAHTSFPALQAEGETLLPRPGEEVYSYDHETTPTPSTPSPDSAPGSPSKTKTPAIGKGRSSWLGSLRRAFVGDSASDNARGINPTAISPSPTHVEQASEAKPRRTVSASATLLRRKQGRGDWEDSEDLEIRPRGTARSSTFAGDVASGTASTTGEYGEDDEWDVERAVQNRVVQIMFTVPKEKLRVVNQDVADDKSEVASLKSRKGSNRSVRESEVPAISGEQTPLVEDVEEKEAEINEPSPLGKGKGKGKGRVKEIVEKIEERNSDDGI
jgi:threonine/homoserine/homoserine lactone efflux protein